MIERVTLLNSTVRVVTGHKGAGEIAGTGSKEIIKSEVGLESENAQK
jgi:hypothetical protein